MNNPKTVLILSGHDPSSGAGIIADVLTAREIGIYPLSVPTVLTLQNSLQFSGMTPVDPEHILRCIDLICEEFSPSTVKIGLIPLEDPTWLKKLSNRLNGFSHIVFDPVLKASTAENYQNPAEPFLDFISGKDMVITPNRRELSLIHRHLFGDEIGDTVSMARKIAEATGTTLIVKHEGTAPFVNIVSGKRQKEIPLRIIHLGREVHGTGCRFSSSVASHLAVGHDLEIAVEKSLRHMEKKLQSNVLFHPEGQGHIF